MYKVTTSAPRQIINESVKEYKSLIAPTYGPAGHGVLIADEHSVKLVDDGYMASQSLNIKSELHNAVISYIKETAAKTNSRVGDGTTTAILLMASIVSQLYDTDTYSMNAQKSFTKEAKGLQTASIQAIAAIKKAAKKIKKQEDLEKIAYNSFNDKESAALIADLVYRTGENGVISVEESQSVQTESSIVQGLEIDKGYASPYLSSGESIFKDVPLLLTTKEFTQFADFVVVVEPIIKEKGKNLVIVAESFADDVLAGVIVNNARGVFNVMLIQAPGYGEYKRNLLEDIAILTGAVVLDPKRGDDYTVGKAERILVTKQHTLFTGTASKEAIQAYVATLIPSGEESDFDKDRRERRAASLLGGIGIIKVGAHTEGEMQAIKAKVEDAVHATQAALRSGVVQGGGLTYSGITTSSEVLNEALKAPRKQLEENGKEFLDDDAKDPAEVLIAALETAVSVASKLITTGSIIAEKREEKSMFE